MSNSTVLSKRVSLLAAKVEATKGTAETLAAADAAMNIFNLQFTPPEKMEERLGQGTLDRLVSIQGEQQAMLEFDWELVGATSTPPLVALTMLRISGFINTSGVFTRTADFSAQKTATMGAYVDGTLKMLAGCCGDFDIECNNGRRGIVHQRVMGKFLGNSDAAVLGSVTFPATKPPRGWQSFTLGSFSPQAPQITFKLNNTMKLLEDKNDSAKTGFAYGIISDSDPQCIIEPYQTLAANNDWYALQAAATAQILSLVVGTASNNTMTLDSQLAEIRSIGKLGDRDRLGTEAITLGLNDGVRISYT